ncbi:hypothetical protein E1301_Tti000184 [Triplophysa tibetana]|uniref:Uncharacterized protein n=1 Tax=Triplophysa tibetana TaxID=1572043 RepID=A0A5A9N4U7_9TELE|nr:hypothetical protein E1301_Tti000184 [Triplophysa tibetana]
MRTAKTECFVCFVLFFGTMRAQNNLTLTTVPLTTKIDTSQITVSPSNENPSTQRETTQQKTNGSHQDCVCTPSPTKTLKGYYIFFELEGNKLTLVLGALMLACFILLLTTLILACHLCNMKVMISKFKPNNNNIDLKVMRKRSESPSRDDGPAVREPTETCVMLSGVTTQEEENKEECVQPIPEPILEGPNGEVAQESGNDCKAESKEPDVETPESSAIEV